LAKVEFAKGAQGMRWISLAAVLWTVAAVGQTLPTTEPTSRPDHATGEDKVSVTHGSVTIGGQAVDYEATAGTMTVKDDSGKPKANFFYVSYTKEPAEKSSDRPITFVFNGGPGAAAVWLHLGAAGPRRIKLNDDGLPGPPPHSLIENDQSWLDVTDLVFIDPVGTGFSRAAEGQPEQQFFGVQGDLDSLSDFIRLYLTRHERWDSPKFLAGESYGTTRAAALSEKLLDGEGIDVNGIILISTVLNFQTLEPSHGNDLPYALYLPSYTAIALYHHKLQTADEDKLLTEVQDYALHDYLEALAKGGSLSKDERADVVAHLARYTGLSPDLIDKANLRIDGTMFRKHLLEDQREILGRFDARVVGPDPEPAGDDPEYDPSLSLFLPVYTSTFNDYVRRVLKYDSDLRYGVLNPLGPWDFGKGGMGYLDVSEALRGAMMENPHLKVLVCSGYEDLATPFLGTKYTFEHLDLLDRFTGNITQTFYHSGHMIYHSPQSLRELKQNIATFIAQATKGN
jgi:carboxypeptidase C (cathepsin A)